MRNLHKLFLAAAVACCFASPAGAQIQKGNLMVGGNLADIDFGLGNASSFSISVEPKLGYFIEDNVVIGGYVNLGFQTVKNAGETYNYGVGAFGRYYFGKDQVESLLKHGRFFAEANIGIGGQNGTPVGLDIGFGPGYAYFITPNVALEALLKYRGKFGVGANNGLHFGLGFQIYLPTSKARAIYEEEAGSRG